MPRSRNGDRSAREPELKQELKEDFEQADSDGDGRINFAEFSSLLEDLESGMSAEELRIGFHEIDTDHDGRIDLPEFIAWWTES